MKKKYKVTIEAYDSKQEFTIEGLELEAVNHICDMLHNEAFCSGCEPISYKIEEA